MVVQRGKEKDGKKVLKYYEKNQSSQTPACTHDHLFLEH